MPFSGRRKRLFRDFVTNGGLTASDSIFYVNFEPIRLKQSGYSVKKSCFENKLSDKTDFVVGGNCRAEFSILSAGQNLQ